MYRPAKSFFTWRSAPSLPVRGKSGQGFRECLASEAEARLSRLNLSQRAIEDINRTIEVRIGDDEGRLDTDDVASLTADADEDACFATKAANLACLFGRGLLGGAVGDQFDADHEA